MTHFGIISPPVSGHLNPFGALGRCLIRRGHRVTLFHMRDLESKAREEGLDFQVLGESDHPAGSLPESLTRLSRLKGLAALRFTVQAIERTTEMICRDGPAAIQAANVDMLLVDQTEPAGGTVAEHLDLPFITVCNALAINRETEVPPPFTGWSFNPSVWGKTRNQLGYHAWDWMMRPIQSTLDRYRRKWNLSVPRESAALFSTRAQLSQQPSLFDFPRRKLPDCFHYLGPFRDAPAKEVPFPWERLDGRPLIYASLGTLQNRTPALFHCIAEACAGLPVQLVITHGGGLTEETVSRLPGSPLVVSYAPQERVLAKARLTLSHAGLNTVLDSLSQGIPVVAIPLTYEQPAIAARLEWSGAGKVVPYSGLSAAKLREVIQEVLNAESYYQAARKIAGSIHQAGGAERAATLIEETLQTLTGAKFRGKRICGD